MDSGTNTTVTTTAGEVRGRVEDGVARYLGVPYAAAPFGEHRFRPPAPVSWGGVRDALEHGPTPPKLPYPELLAALLPEPFVAGEEILNVAVWAPEGAAGAPVMVFFHGGAFTNGSNAVPVYDGTAFARAGVVLVSVNYRLGAEGFLHLPGVPANRGLLDQIAALRWVRDNISAFGGDPGAVTVFGESAGAMGIATLMAMPAAEGLFQRAILQSGAGHHTHQPATAALVAAELADAVGVPVEELAGVAPERLLAGQAELLERFQTDPRPERWGESARSALLFAPVVDGESLPAPAIERIAAGAGRDVDVLVGANRDELLLFLVPFGAVDVIGEDAVAAVAAQYGLPDGAVDRYRANRPGAGAGHLYSDIATDSAYRIPAVRLAEAHGRAHVYEFAWSSAAFDGRLGACHALELPFVFGTFASSPEITGPNPPDELADAMRTAWVAFAASGDPGWPRYGSERAVRTFGETPDTVLDPRADLRELWDGIR
ncbi:carboxylesterase family protein [Actinomycetes bacterium KLBMP 9759]